MTPYVILDDAIVQVRAALIGKDGPERIALSGLSDGPAAGAIVSAQVTKRLGGHEDCIVTLSDGSEAHLSGRRGGRDPDLTQGASFIAEVVRAGDIDKRPEVRRVAADTALTPYWDEIDQFLSTLPPGFDGDIRVATPQLWSRRVSTWQAQFAHLKDAFKQDFQEPGAKFADSGADDALLALMSERWPLPGGGDIRFGSVSGITVFDINTGPATGQKGALAANLSAARALPQLISIGAFGGLMVADFIDLKAHGDQGRVLEAFDAASAALGLKIKRTGWSKFGMVELQAHRQGNDLSAQLLSREGAGYHAPRIALLTLQKALALLPRPMVLRVAEPVQRWLAAHEGVTLLSERLSLSITVVAEDDMSYGAWALEPAP
ncbi:MAG: ribonuclease E/G [Pseudomonadota bacterium]